MMKFPASQTSRKADIWFIVAVILAIRNITDNTLIPKLKQQLQLMNCLLDILPTFAGWLIMASTALDHASLKECDLVSLDVLDWLNRAVLVMASTFLLF